MKKQAEKKAENDTRYYTATAICLWAPVGLAGGALIGALCGGVAAGLLAGFFLGLICGVTVGAVLDGRKRNRASQTDYETELRGVMEQLAENGRFLVAVPAQRWLDGQKNRAPLIAAIQQSEEECIHGGRKIDPLYHKALLLLTVK